MRSWRSTRAHGGTCPVYTGTAAGQGSDAFCTVAHEDVTIAYDSGVVTRTSRVSQAAADAAAAAAAQQLVG